MTPTEYNRLLQIAGAVHKCAGEEAALAVLTSSGITKTFARIQLARLTQAKQSPKRKGLSLLGTLVSRRPRKTRQPTTERCFVIAPLGQAANRSKLNEKAIRYFRDQIIRPALAPLPYTTFWSRAYSTELKGTEKMLDAISSASFVIALLSPANTRTFYELGMAQAAGKPILSLAANRSEVPRGKTRVRAVYYGHYSSRVGLESSIKAKVISHLREGATALVAEAPVSDPRLLRYRACSNLEKIYDGKEYALRQFWIDVCKIAEEMQLDHELTTKRNPGALRLIAKSLKVPGDTFSDQCDCLHKTLESAMDDLPTEQSAGCLRVCARMDALAKRSRDWVDEIFRKTPTQSDIPGAHRILAALGREIIVCRDMILAERKRLHGYL